MSGDARPFSRGKTPLNLLPSALCLKFTQLLDSDRGIFITDNCILFLNQLIAKAQTSTSSITAQNTSTPAASTELKRLLDTKEYVECNLSGADLDKADLQGANLKGANLQNAD